MTLDLDILWHDLETEAKNITENGLLKRQILPASSCSMFLGVNAPELQRLFLLRSRQSLFPSKDKIPQSYGFSVTVLKLDEDPDDSACFVLSVNSAIFNDIFSAMTKSLCQKLTTITNEKEAVHTFLDQLIKWQHFFERPDAIGLSPEAQRGLYGELYLLKNHLLSSSKGMLHILSSWVGSQNRQHDFQFSTASIEVKTCSSKQSQKLIISSEQQLDETLVPALYLYHLSLSIIENNNNTLPVIIEDIRGSIISDHAASRIFEDILISRGYLDTHTNKYTHIGYSVREENLFHVTKGFPKLTERDIPTGVGDLKYSVEVSACKNFTVVISEIIENI